MATMLESSAAGNEWAAGRQSDGEGGAGKNVGGPERLASLAGGGLLALAGLKRGGLGGVLTALAGAALLERGATGHCRVYGGLGLSSAKDDTGHRLAGPGSVPTFDSTVTVSNSLTVNRPAGELYRFWREARNLPRFMSRVELVREESPTRARWTMSAPMGRTWEWDAEIVEEEEGRRIAWRSLEGGDLPNRGSVTFAPDTRGEETVVTYRVEFDPPLGALGAAVASVFHEVPEQMARADLRRFKALMETGEIPTTEGQPSCRGRTE
ncbi:MAG TPA: SRPBCC family protein [Longimicrobiaceae bacterium]|nr:SRPBCC family protein [Longimicrobiaceae bacterium]